MIDKEKYVQTKSFREIYKGLSNKTKKKTPKAEFVERIANVTCREPTTVRQWLSGTQRPDRLVQEVISKELGVPIDDLFPEPKAV
ncbi:MAG: XRE family transcriptional regulator [Tannerellaceae bacterium]|nr:XRE family transcriptional regulator [Tannerellaceae bacterium]